MGPLRILIADDNESVRTGIRLLLGSREEWEVCGEAVDGEDAIQKAATLQPDVILLDLSMPKMDGLTAMPILREKSPDSQIIVLTLHECVETARYASKAGATAYITKSLISELIPALKALQPFEG
jgi:two-component system, NarL family, response regulator NreC